jgi:hypothetical protein
MHLPQQPKICFSTQPLQEHIDANISHLIYESPGQTHEGTPISCLYRQDVGGFLLRVHHVADYWLNGQTDEIHYCLAPGQSNLEGEPTRNIALSLWHELHHAPALHASVVAIDGQGIGFLADSYQGKSSLTAMLITAGHPLLTDDVLPLYLMENTELVYGTPGNAFLKLWRSVAQHFFGEDAPKRFSPIIFNAQKYRIPVGDGFPCSFWGDILPIHTLYVLSRGDENTPIKITPCGPAEAVMHMVRYSLVGRMAQALGLGGERLAFLGRCLPAISIRTLQYPSGFDHLPTVRNAILKDIE